MTPKAYRAKTDAYDREHMDERVNEICGLAIAEMQDLHDRMSSFHTAKRVIMALWENQRFSSEDPLAKILDILSENCGKISNGDRDMTRNLLESMRQYDFLANDSVIFQITAEIEKQMNALESEIEEFIDIKLSDWSSAFPIPHLKQQI